MGSRSHFWAPLSTAKIDGDKVKLNARKSWATSANHADSYVWSSKPLAGTEASSIWLVPANTPGLRITEAYAGLGLRGNDSCPITAEDATIDRSAMLGADGEGFKIECLVFESRPGFLVTGPCFCSEALLAWISCSKWLD